jgi:oligoribonuclease
VKFVSIDVETLGVDPQTCDLIEFAAVIEVTSSPALPVENLPHLRVVMAEGRIHPDGQFTGHPEALAMHPALFREVADALSERRATGSLPPGFALPDDLTEMFKRFLGEHGWPGTPITLAGKNLGTFDLRFLRRLPNWNRLRHRRRLLDPGPMLARPEDECVPDLAECCRRAGIPAPEGHHALDDARAVVRLVRRAWGLDDPEPGEREGGAS